MDTTLGSTKDRVLNLLKVNGPMTVKELSEDIGITLMGVRQHLEGLLKDDYVKFDWLRQGRGRPSQLFSLTDSGHGLFPQNYGNLAVSFLQDIQALGGPDLVDELFARRADRMRGRYATEIASAKKPGERVEILAHLRSEEGYMASVEVQEDDSFLLIEAHCPIRKVAEQTECACNHELELFQDLFKDAKVTREDHLVSGDRHCSYRFRFD